MLLTSPQMLRLVAADAESRCGNFVWCEDAAPPASWQTDCRPLAGVMACSPGCPLKRQNITAFCGFRTGIECLPRPYTIADITSPPQEDLQALYDTTRNAAMRACNCVAFDRMKSGAWCLSQRGKNATHFDLPQGHHPPQPGFVAGLDQLLRVQTPADGTTYLSVADFGAGVGQLGRALLARDPRHQYQAYDGSGNVEDWTKGFVRFADVTKPLALPKAHWVVTTEAGEHVPNALEGTFIRNLHAHNCLGIILTWANLNQGGTAHINNHDPLYLRTLFEELGYTFDEQLTAQLLLATGRVPSPQFQNATACLEQMFQPPARLFYPCCTLQVLRRKKPLRGACKPPGHSSRGSV